MNLREITIGRSKNCDIYLDDRCVYASSVHGTLYYDGDRLMFKDTSTNGTLINNVNVKHRAVPIHPGDIIMLAGKYQVGWNQIEAFFPQCPSYSKDPRPSVEPSPVSQPVYKIETPDLSKWSWGAFGIYPIWGFANGCWWAFIISLFFGVFYPLPNIFFGIYGNRLSWENKSWTSIQDFESSQETWSIVGIVFTCINLVFYIIYILVLIDA